MELTKEELKVILFWRTKCEEFFKNSNTRCGMAFLLSKENTCSNLEKKIIKELKKYEPFIEKLIESEEEKGVEVKPDYIG